GDANHDGKLSRAEVPGKWRPHIPLADTDGDGFVSRDEFLRIAGQASPVVQGGKVKLLKDIDYVGNGNPRQKLDLLLPESGTAKKRPLVVMIHGGGWMSGRKEDGLDVVRLLAGTGDYVTATINYRLTQEASWPAQIFDCKAAIRFLRAKADQYGIDAGKIGVMGFSAGGHLVSMLGTSGDVKELEGDLGEFKNISSRVQGVVNFFGPTDFLTIFGKDVKVADVPKDNMAIRLLGKNEEEIRRNAKLASPVNWITRDDAPFFTAHGTKDSLVPFAQAEELDRALAKTGVESHLVAMEGAGHGFASQELNLRIKQFLDLHLRGVPAGEISTAPIRAN
ncbi:alpha/beta hydrolase fold domain-containing protein, partial [Luteolibacter marinus]|uniref:alpha/beta hydrolase fold domain-containing protein n=1 Tax=Luteolibacter marinus TaxID=2776705 RepID=UPI001867B31D